MKTRILIVVVAAAVFLGLWALLERRTTPPRTEDQATAVNEGAPQAPNPVLTPGDVLTTDLTVICKVGYSKTVRDVSPADHRGVFADYGITNPERGEYEVDHLISLQLGGSNKRTNLWPQSYRTFPYNAHLKDKLENRLRKMACNGEISIQDAQHRIATDWIGTYNAIYGAPVATSH
jgi:hypothetical protein